MAKTIFEDVFFGFHLNPGHFPDIATAKFRISRYRDDRELSMFLAWDLYVVVDSLYVRTPQLSPCPSHSQDPKELGGVNSLRCEKIPVAQLSPCPSHSQDPKELRGVNRLRCEQITVAQPRFTPAGGVPRAGEKSKKNQLALLIGLREPGVIDSREMSKFSRV